MEHPQVAWEDMIVVVHMGCCSSMRCPYIGPGLVHNPHSHCTLTRISKEHVTRDHHSSPTLPHHHHINSTLVIISHTQPLHSVSDHTMGKVGIGLNRTQWEALGRVACIGWLHTATHQLL